MEGFKKKKKKIILGIQQIVTVVEVFFFFFFFEKTGVNKSSDNSSFMLSNVLIIIFQVLIVKKIDNFSLIKLFIFSKSYASLFIYLFNASLYVALENSRVHIFVPLINGKLFSFTEGAFPPLFSSHKICGDMTLPNFLKSFYFLI